MVNRKRFKQIEEIAERLIQQTDASSLPILVDQVATRLNLHVVKYNFGPEISGVLIQQNGSVTIGYNEEDSANRQRFTIAHEIGHYVLGHQREGMFVDNPSKNFSLIFRDGNSSTGEFLQEREANAFAAALLMPRSLLEGQISETSFDLSDGENLVQELSVLFGVSTQAMTYRLANLGILVSAS